MLCYCGNVHAGEDLAEVLASLARGPAKVRAALGESILPYGLWLSRRALSELLSSGVGRLEDCLEEHSLEVHTCNAFPFGNFHARRVKKAVYKPDWSSTERAHYSLEVAEVLAQLLPPGASMGTLSTLPLGYRGEMPAAALPSAASALVSVAAGLAELEARTGRCIRLCLEPEPGCWLESSADVAEFWNRHLRPEAGQHRLHGALERHLGVCWDTCHHAVAFEDPKDVAARYAEHAIGVFKVQLSCAIELDGSDARARAALASFAEDRFLHQVRAQMDDEILAIDDLDAAETLPHEALWRVHFHVPIHTELAPPLRRTSADLSAALQHLRALPTPPHWEVETYTWNVLPKAYRPRDERTLIQGLAAELSWARERLA